MTKKETTYGAITLLALFIIIAMSVYSCSVVFIKGTGNTVRDADEYKLRHSRSIDFAKDSIYIEEDSTKVQ